MFKNLETLKFNFAEERFSSPAELGVGRGTKCKESRNKLGKKGMKSSGGVEVGNLIAVESLDFSKILPSIKSL